jgi:hypothetical protein
MANKKITELTEETSPAGADLLPLVDDVSGTPTTKKVTVTNLMTLAPVQTADISGLQAEPTEGAFVDGDKTKLDGIEALADVTDTANVTAAGALMDTEVTNLAQVKAFDSSDYATAAHTHAIDDLSDVDTSTVAPTTNDFLKWGGSNWVPAVPTADVDTPLTTALRGTTNPHIGAFPNQSFKVTDNPSKSVMVIADADGNLDFLVKTDDANIFLNTPSARKAASFGFSVVEDSSEPDIEVAGTLAGSDENYSVISGDSDSKGANGLPIRQGFNLPDIGANPAPTLISGGTIA